MNWQEQRCVPLGLYVHVPFCITPCDYCAFYKEHLTVPSLQRYIHCLNLEIQRIHDTRSFDTIYFGGGTPGILNSNHIAQIGESIHKIIQKIPVEWTVEFSPPTVSEEKIKRWQSFGTNRISIGVQSFNEQILQKLGRKQSRQQIFQSYELIRKTGFQNVGIDLIFSVPGQTVSQLIEDLSTAISLAPEHISAYCLTYENDTPLTQKEGDCSNENRDHDFYEIVCDFLENSGYKQYEISNFCRHGYASIHNRNTWLMADWIGIGPSASSQYQGYRRTHIASLQRWANGIETNNPKYMDIVPLDSKILAADKIIFGIRMNEGLNLNKNIHATKLAPFFRDLKKEKLLLWEGSHIRLTCKGRLLCDAIAKNIFNILDQ